MSPTDLHLHQARVLYAAKPEDFVEAFASTFNTGSLDAVAAGYSVEAILNLGGGSVFRGRQEIRSALANFLAPRLPINVKPVTQIASGDTALVVFDWAISGTAPDGSKVEMAGRATDVLRREADGVWRQVLDQPFGSATQPA